MQDKPNLALLDGHQGRLARLEAAVESMTRTRVQLERSLRLIARSQALLAQKVITLHEIARGPSRQGAWPSRGRALPAAPAAREPLVDLGNLEQQ
ncbi:MAG: hypothetical protein JSS04_25585 [Proteobacteria bacterium]|nr:hypothetical protein [Pseudomonadota bacterium]